MSLCKTSLLRTRRRKKKKDRYYSIVILYEKSSITWSIRIDDDTQHMLITYSAVSLFVLLIRV